MPDYHILPIQIENGQEQTSLMPGMLYAVPPKRAARNRAADRLLLWLRLEGSAPLPPHATQGLLEKASQMYFRNNGSVTAALRGVADTLNQFLLERNVKNTRAGRQSIGLLGMLSLRGNGALIALAGPLHGWLLSNTIVHWYDPQLAGRGLGLSKNVNLRFFQAEFSAGDYLLFSPEPSPQWTEANLSASHGLPMEQLRRRLLQQQPMDLAALLIQIREGQGRFIIHTARPAARAAVASAAELTAPAAELPAPVIVAEVLPQPEPAEPLAAEGTALEPEPAEVVPVIQPVIPAPQPVQKTDSALKPVTQTTAAPAPRRQPPRPASAKPARPRAEQGQTLRGIYALLLRWKAFWQGVGAKLQQAGGKLLPGEAHQALSLSGGQKLFVALAIPLVIVAMASVVYFQRGRDKQYQAYFLQAQAAASQTVGVEELGVLRAAWEQTLNYLDQAEAYKTTSESQALRRQALTYLDGVDAVQRLDFQAAIVGGLDDSVNITQMATLLDDLYMLDSSRGRILRASLSGRGYEVDGSFLCGAGQYAGTIVTPLVTMAAPPLGSEPGVSVMGLDANGVLVTCSAGSPGPLVRALIPPESGWGKIQAMIVTANTIYVLDPQMNAVWFYSRSALAEAPHSFFGSGNPPPLGDAITMALNQNDLFILHSDGRITTCTRDPMGVAGTNCQPGNFTDPRPGRGTTSTTLPGVTFSQVIFTNLPESSLYLFSPATQTIYHFSYKLNLRRLLEPLRTVSSPVPRKEATGFTINLTQTVFMAVGNRVFFAQATP